MFDEKTTIQALFTASFRPPPSNDGLTAEIVDEQGNVFDGGERDTLGNGLQYYFIII